MAKGDVYIGITKYLEKQNVDVLTLSFEDIKKINNKYLPSSAYKHPAWWANTDSHSQAFGWMNAGYKTVEVNLEKQCVTLKKCSEG